MKKYIPLPLVLLFAINQTGYAVEYSFQGQFNPGSEDFFTGDSTVGFTGLISYNENQVPFYSTSVESQYEINDLSITFDRKDIYGNTSYSLKNFQAIPSPYGNFGDKNYLQLRNYGDNPWDGFVAQIISDNGPSATYFDVNIYASKIDGLSNSSTQLSTFKLDDFFKNSTNGISISTSNLNDVFNGQAHSAGTISNIQLIPTTPYAPQKYALLTGWENNGSNEIKDWLIDLGWNPKNIKTIDENDPETGEKIEQYISSLKVNQNDQFLFYYKGHGGYDDVKNSVEHEGETHKSGSVGLEGHDGLTWEKDEALAYSSPGSKSSFYSLYDDTLTALFDNDKWENVAKMFILDSCLSQGFYGGKDSDGTGDLDELKNTFFIYAAKENELTQMNRLTNTSFLTNYILEIGLEQKRADINQDGNITLAEMQSWFNNFSMPEAKHDWLELIDWKLGLDILSEATPITGSFPAGTDYATILKFLGTPGIQTNMDEHFLNSSFNNEPVPEPTTILLFGTGIAGLIAARRRKKA